MTSSSPILQSPSLVGWNVVDLEVLHEGIPIKIPPVLGSPYMEPGPNSLVRTPVSVERIIFHLKCYVIDLKH